MLLISISPPLASDAGGGFLSQYVGGGLIFPQNQEKWSDAV
jgi:hypothetical protein